MDSESDLYKPACDAPTFDPAKFRKAGFCLPIHTEEIDKLTEWADWFGWTGGFFRTHRAGIGYAKGAEMEFVGWTRNRQSKTTATGGTGILRYKV